MKRTDLQLPGHAMLFQGVPHYTADQMREYGKACERAAYERAAQECREQAKFHAVHRDYRYDFKADGANECAAAIEALGADK